MLFRSIMCMFCAAIPAASAVGAKLNVDQKRKIMENGAASEKPVLAVTAGVVFFLLIGSVVYHTTFFGR